MPLSTPVLCSPCRTRCPSPRGWQRSRPCRMTGTRGGPARCLGTLLALCLAAPPAATACPRLCACYVPTEVHCTFRYFTAVPPHIPPDVERINLGYVQQRDFKPSDQLPFNTLQSHN